MNQAAIAIIARTQYEFAAPHPGNITVTRANAQDRNILSNAE
jgi:hypothetical protein